MKNKELIGNVIMRSVQKRLGNDYTISLGNVLKNNGLTLTGLAIKKEGEHISPTIYIDNFISSYKSTELEQITDEIIRIYHAAPMDFTISPFVDFNWVKEKIIYHFVNTSMNEELLKDVPSVPFLDLSIVFRVMIDSASKDCMTSILINNSHLKGWNVTKEIIYKLATENTQKLLPARVSNILGTIKRQCSERDLLIDGFDFEHDPYPMYVLTNPKGLYGSICIKYSNILTNFAEATNSDLFILPSSVHEVLLFPDFNGTVMPMALKEIVHDVNRTAVSREEFLSDSVYFFSRETQELTQV